MNSRRILCMGDPVILAGMSLVTLVKLLARAIVHHLGEYAVVVQPGGTSYFYEPANTHVIPPTPHMAIVEGAAAAIWGGLAPRTVHFLVLDHPNLDVFLATPNSYFDVVTPFIPYAHRFLPLPATVTDWLLPAGKGMPAVVLPSTTTGNAGPIQFYDIDDDWNAPNPPERDSCRMRMNPAQVNAADAEPNWSNIQPVSIRKTFERWARTVTWKRVGICISGGGASVFRLVPLFEALENEGLPVDLLAGVSGGTIFSACYAVGGLQKVNQLADNGSSFMMALTGALLTSWFVQRYVDNFFQDCGMCNTEIRVLPMTAKLAPMSPPRPAAMVDGTFGQALRASGGAPFFGPFFVGDSRQTDGAVLAGLPPPFLAERFGADIVFAMNVLALPANRFPGETVPILGDIVGVFYRYTPVGRLLDTYGATSTMLHTIAEGAGMHADVFVDTPPRDFAPFEQFLLFNSVTYSNVGLGAGVDVTAVAQDCVARWKAL
jgi:predicted acylesterase/phospholipase RssA